MSERRSAVVTTGMWVTAAGPLGMIDASMTLSRSVPWTRPEGSTTAPSSGRGPIVVFEHTINYRSAMIHGRPRLVAGPGKRLAGLRRIAEHAAPGQWDYVRQPSRKELAAVRLLALSLDEASVKIRTGPPSDGDSPDAALGLWAGELPLATSWQQPIPDPALPPGIPLPAHIRARAGTRADQSTREPGSRTDKRSEG